MSLGRDKHIEYVTTSLTKALRPAAHSDGVNVALDVLIGGIGQQ